MTDYITPVISNLVQTALYVDFTDGILLVIVCLSIIFTTQDYRIGLMALLLLSSLAYVFFVLNNLLLAHVTMLVFVAILLMAFSFFITKKPGGAMLS